MLASLIASKAPVWRAAAAGPAAHQALPALSLSLARAAPSLGRSSMSTWRGGEGGHAGGMDEEERAEAGGTAGVEQRYDQMSLERLFVLSNKTAFVTGAAQGARMGALACLYRPGAGLFCAGPAVAGAQARPLRSAALVPSVRRHRQLGGARPGQLRRRRGAGGCVAGVSSVRLQHLFEHSPVPVRVPLCLPTACPIHQLESNDINPTRPKPLQTWATRPS